MRRARGFTLLELLVGLVVFSLLTMATYASMRTAMRGWEGGSARATAVARMRSVESFVRQHLAQALATTQEDGEGRQTVEFEGSATSVRLITELPPHLGGGGLYELELVLDDAGPEEQLIVRFRPALGDLAEEGPEPETSVLLEGVLDGGFEYYGAQERGATPGWHTEWADAEDLPALVRLRLETAAVRGWPDIVVRPRAHTPRRDGRRGRGDDDEEEQEQEQEQGADGEQAPAADRAGEAAEAPAGPQAGAAGQAAGQLGGARR